MQNYNNTYKKNFSTYLNIKGENKNFLKKYMLFKKKYKYIHNDEIVHLYGNILEKYSRKNYHLSKKCLSGENIFKENGLLMYGKKEIADYYKKEIQNNGNNNKRVMREIIFINGLFEELEQKKLNHKASIQKNPLILKDKSKRRKSAVADMLETYKESQEYQIAKDQENLEQINIIKEKQKEIKDDQRYIRTIKKLINKNEKEMEKKRAFYNDSDNANLDTLFVINRYTKNNFRNTKSVFNSTNTNFKKLNKYKSAGNIYSSLYKDNDTTNSTFINNNKETKMTTFLSRNNNKDITNKRSSYKTSIDYSDFNDGYNTIKNSNYIMIDDTSKTIKKISPIKNNINSKNNINKQNNSKNKNTDIKKNINNDNSKEKLSMTSFNKTNKTNFYNISSYSNLTSIKNERNSKKIKIRNSKLSFNTNDNKKISKFTISKDDFDKKDLSWNLYKKFVGLKYKLESNNNHKLDNFCNTFTSLPKIVNDKLNKSFILDEKIKETHHNYIKSLLETKIRGFEKDENVSV
jgi:hypothetical protein